jgi:hypothetical protein
LGAIKGRRSSSSTAGTSRPANHVLPDTFAMTGLLTQGLVPMGGNGKPPGPAPPSFNCLSGFQVYNTKV